MTKGGLYEPKQVHTPHRACGSQEPLSLSVTLSVSLPAVQLAPCKHTEITWCCMLKGGKTLTPCVAGVNTLGDLGRMLEGLPRPFVDFLKVQAIIRGAATKLGSSLHDRLRINATYALKVMFPAHSASLPIPLLFYLSS